MQTISIDRDFGSNASSSRRNAQIEPALEIVSGRAEEPAPGTWSEPSSAGAFDTSARLHRQQSFSELDEMLWNDPNTGAFRGLRVALLFNLGLVLSGLVIWEIWTMLA